MSSPRLGSKTERSATQNEFKYQLVTETETARLEGVISPVLNIPDNNYLPLRTFVVPTLRKSVLTLEAPR